MRFRRQVIDDDRDNIKALPNEFHTDVTVKFINRSILSAVSSTWWYSGGAHGNSFRSAINVSVEDRSLFPASALFRDVQTFRPFLADAIASTGERPLANADDLPRLVEEALAGSSFLSDSGLQLLFDPYEIFPYSFGNFDVLVPLDHDLLADNNLTEFGRKMLSSLR